MCICYLDSTFRKCVISSMFKIIICQYSYPPWCLLRYAWHICIYFLLKFVYPVNVAKRILINTYTYKK